MKIYIDFDGTIFDTSKYTSDFMNIFNEYGINNDLFYETKSNIFINDNLFNLVTIIDYFIDNYNIDIELKNKIYNLLNTSYLYSEVMDCLWQLKNMGYELYLLTYGNECFQKFKINASNIDKCFKEIIITNKNKSELNLDYENSIFIDNNPIVLENLYDSKAKKLIRIKRNLDRYTNEKCKINNLIECTDFNQVVQYLEGGFNNE